MLAPRIIPCLLVSGGGVVKTRRFSDRKYIGDPINTVRIFNEKRVDEIVVLDIDSTSRSTPIDFRQIQNIAAECRMPLCYGGGVKRVAEIETIIGLGVEKVAISSEAIKNNLLVHEAARHVGSQSIVVVVDAKMNLASRRYTAVIENGRIDTRIDVEEIVKRVQDAGAGEIVINAVDRDGEMSGFDLELASRICELVKVPLTFMGGAGTLQDFSNLFSKHRVSGAAAGSFFVFKGKLRAVLLSYPNSEERKGICLPTYPRA